MRASPGATTIVTNLLSTWVTANISLCGENAAAFMMHQLIRLRQCGSTEWRVRTGIALPRLSQRHDRDTKRSTATDPNGRTLDTRNARSAVFNRGTKDKRAYLHLHCHHSPSLHLQVTQTAPPRSLATTRHTLLLTLLFLTLRTLLDKRAYLHLGRHHLPHTSQRSSMQILHRRSPPLATHRRNTASTSARMEDFRHRPAIVAEAKELALVWLHRMSVGSQVCLYAFLSPAVFS